jgi:hypothetical protein
MLCTCIICTFKFKRGIFDMTATTTATEWKTKLSVGVLGIKPKEVLAGLTDDKKKPVARIYGRANEARFQPDADTGGGYLFFSGMFEGFNMLDGTILQSNRLYLPDGVAEMLEDVIRKQQERDKKASVEFSVEIQIARGEARSERAAGYEYHAHFIKKPGAADELAMLREASALKPEEVRKHARQSA